MKVRLLFHCFANLPLGHVPVFLIRPAKKISPWSIGQHYNHNVYICVVLTIINKKLRETKHIYVVMHRDESWDTLH